MDINKWSNDDRRIALADDVASGHHRLESITNDIVEIECQTFLQHIKEAAGSVVITRDGLLMLANKKNKAAYMGERDDRRRLRGGDAKW